MVEAGWAAGGDDVVAVVVVVAEVATVLMIDRFATAQGSAGVSGTGNPLNQLAVEHDVREV